MGYYEVNVRLNEKATSEADAFAAATTADAEAAFFATDVSVPGFTGRVSYVDTFEGESVIASKVSYAIASSSASKVQTMNLAKILLLMVGPFNDE
jgi:ethanolamine utilization microcompartment shell protein EutS